MGNNYLIKDAIQSGTGDLSGEITSPLRFEFTNEGFAELHRRLINIFGVETQVVPDIPLSNLFPDGSSQQVELEKGTDVTDEKFRQWSRDDTVTFITEVATEMFLDALYGDDPWTGTQQRLTEQIVEDLENHFLDPDRDFSDQGWVPGTSEWNSNSPWGKFANSKVLKFEDLVQTQKSNKSFLFKKNRQASIVRELYREGKISNELYDAIVNPAFIDPESMVGQQATQLVMALPYYEYRITEQVMDSTSGKFDSGLNRVIREIPADDWQTAEGLAGLFPVPESFRRQEAERPRNQDLYNKFGEEKDLRKALDSILGPLPPNDIASSVETEARDLLADRLTETRSQILSSQRGIFPEELGQILYLEAQSAVQPGYQEDAEFGRELIPVPSQLDQLRQTELTRYIQSNPSTILDEVLSEYGALSSDLSTELKDDLKRQLLGARTFDDVAEIITLSVVQEDIDKQAFDEYQEKRQDALEKVNTGTKAKTAVTNFLEQWYGMDTEIPDYAKTIMADSLLQSYTEAATDENQLAMPPDPNDVLSQYEKFIPNWTQIAATDSTAVASGILGIDRFTSMNLDADMAKRLKTSADMIAEGIDKSLEASPFSMRTPVDMAQLFMRGKGITPMGELKPLAGLENIMNVPLDVMDAAAIAGTTPEQYAEAFRQQYDPSRPPMPSPEIMGLGGGLEAIGGRGVLPMRDYGQELTPALQQLFNEGSPEFKEFMAYQPEFGGPSFIQNLIDQYRQSQQISRDDTSGVMGAAMAAERAAAKAAEVPAYRFDPTEEGGFERVFDPTGQVTEPVQYGAASAAWGDLRRAQLPTMEEFIEGRRDAIRTQYEASPFFREEQARLEAEAERERAIKEREDAFTQRQRQAALRPGAMAIFGRRQG